LIGLPTGIHSTWPMSFLGEDHGDARLSCRVDQPCRPSDDLSRAGRITAGCLVKKVMLHVDDEKSCSAMNKLGHDPITARSVQVQMQAPARRRAR
jgi:hypothetical protein